jgi:hypothetical protein
MTRKLGGGAGFGTSRKSEATGTSPVPPRRHLHEKH